MQERPLRHGSARAAQKFDVLHATGATSAGPIDLDTAIEAEVAGQPSHAGHAHD